MYKERSRVDADGTVNPTCCLTRQPGPGLRTQSPPPSPHPLRPNTHTPHPQYTHPQTVP